MREQPINAGHWYNQLFQLLMRIKAWPPAAKATLIAIAVYTLSLFIPLVPGMQGYQCWAYILPLVQAISRYGYYVLLPLFFLAQISFIERARFEEAQDEGDSVERVDGKSTD